MDRLRRSDGAASQIEVEAGWWTTGGKFGPPLARHKGVGKIQHNIHILLDIYFYTDNVKQILVFLCSIKDLLHNSAACQFIFMRLSKW